MCSFIHGSLRKLIVIVVSSDKLSKLRQANIIALVVQKMLQRQ